MLKTEENKWNEEEMKSYSNFQPKHITDQNKHIFGVWEWHCLSAVVTHSFLLYFSPLGVFWGSSQSLFHLPSPRLSSSAGWASTRWGSCQHELVVSRSSSPTLRPVPSPGHLPVWEQSWPLPFSPHPPTALSSHAAIFNPDWSLASLHSPRGLLLLPTETLWNYRVNPSFFRLPKALISLGSSTPCAGSVPPDNMEGGTSLFPC